MVAAHTQVVSFPETHFFSKTLPINPFLRRIKLYGPKSRTVIREFLDAQGLTEVQPFREVSDYRFYTHSPWCGKLMDTLDQMMQSASGALESGEQIRWALEKTPRHLYYISSIRQADRSSKFLHMLREGADVVASMHLATKRYPREWNGERSVDECIRWWNNSIRESLKYRDEADHFFVTYGQLTEDPVSVLRPLCRFLHIDFQQKMIEEFHETAGSLTTEEEKWKAKNSRKSLQKSNKLEAHFDEQTIAHIRENLLDINLEEFRH